jgi:hypothetical protein
MALSLSGEDSRGPGRGAKGSCGTPTGPPELAALQRAEGLLELPARAGNRRFGPLSVLRAHTKSPYKMDFHRKTRMALNRPGRPGPRAAHRELVHRDFAVRRVWPRAPG